LHEAGKGSTRRRAAEVSCFQAPSRLQKALQWRLAAGRFAPSSLDPSGGVRMADLWYYTNEGRQMDPVSTAEIQQLAQRGLLKPTDMVWRDGMSRWVRSSAAPELFPANSPSFERGLGQNPRGRSSVEESAPLLDPVVLDAVPDGTPDV